MLQLLMLLRVAPCSSAAADPQPDPRWIPNGAVLRSGGYSCQPYCVVMEDDGSWTCVLTYIHDPIWVEGQPGEHMVSMRREEGEALQRDLEGYLQEIQSLLEQVVAQSDGVANRLELRLMERLNRLVGDRVDENRLAQEAAIQADKADIAEELTRLASHFEQFGTALVQEGPVGRRLDFLTQEMNREINTIGSKSSEAGMQKVVVQMKDELEKIKEQLLNVL